MGLFYAPNAEIDILDDLWEWLFGKGGGKFTLYAHQGDWESDPVGKATDLNQFYMGIYTMSRAGVRARV